MHRVDRAGRLFGRLSSATKKILMTITKLVEGVEEHTPLMDEPEALTSIHRICDAGHALPGLFVVRLCSLAQVRLKAAMGKDRPFQRKR